MTCVYDLDAITWSGGGYAQISGSGQLAINGEARDATYAMANACNYQTYQDCHYNDIGWVDSDSYTDRDVYKVRNTYGNYLISIQVLKD